MESVAMDPHGFMLNQREATDIIKVFIYSLIFKKEKKEIYYQRLSGLFNAIIGKNSWYRPKV